jgi:serine phosphatase RsbU (regulator of sigma subunit)
MTETLKLFAVESETATVDRPRGSAALRDVQEAFAAATGWRLYAEVVDEFDSLPGDPSTADARPLRVAPLDDSALYGGGIERFKAQRLATAIGRLTDELRGTDRALRMREAEAAVGAMTSRRSKGLEHLATRWSEILRDGAKMLGCRAAGVYLLGGDSMRLKLRASWKLNRRRLSAPARALAECAGDLNALSNFNVALASRQETEAWNAPISCSAAICVPLMSGNVPLGTLWFFSGRPRKFSQRQTAFARVFADRVVAELERESLQLETERLTSLRDELNDVKQVRRGDGPAPQLENWTIAGWTRRSAGISGAFHAWRGAGDESAWTAVSECNGKRLVAAQRAAALSASLQSIWRLTDSPPALLANANAQLWEREAGDALATAAAARVSAQGKVTLSVAGDPCVLLITADGTKELTDVSAPLGLGSRMKPAEHAFNVPLGAALVLTTSGVRDALDARGRLFGAQGISQALRHGANGNAQSLANQLSDALDAHTQGVQDADCSAIVICRR